MNLKSVVIVTAHALVGWALCGAVVMIGRNIMSMQTTMIIHAVAVPIIFGIISVIYFKRFAYTMPLTTALLFTAIIILLDICVVAILIEKSYEMFTDPLGTWIPFALIFITTYATGKHLRRAKA